MDARSARFGPWLGGAILLGLMTLMVVVAGIRGTVVVGRSVAVPVPAPPEPGHCLLENPFDEGSNGYFLVGDELPSWRTGRCAGARFGEVVTIGAGVELASSFPAGLWEQCWRDGLGYLGLPDPMARDDHRAPGVNVQTALIGPSERQRAAGQDWAACVIQWAPFGSGGALNAEYSLRDAWSRAEDRRLLALCLNDRELQYPVGCREPHDAEQVSSWMGDPAGFGQPDDDTCRTDATGALGSSAALDRGALTALALPIGWDEGTGRQITGPEAVSADQPYLVICLLVPGDRSKVLVGPLRELGDAPVPLG